MTRKIFRQGAMEHLASPEQLDRLMPLTSPRGWIALAGAGLLLLLAMLWTILGTLATTLEGTGVLTRSGGVWFVEAPRMAAVAKISVRSGDKVDKGQALAELTPAQLGPDATPLLVASPCAGRVLEIAVVQGNLVREGEKLLAIESPAFPLQAVVYVSAYDGYRVETDREVRITPATRGKGDSPFLWGRVQSVGKFPATHGAMMRTLQNEGAVNRLLGFGPMLEIVADVTRGDCHEDLFSGTPCQALITVEKKRPIQFILPGAPSQ